MTERQLGFAADGAVHYPGALPADDVDRLQRLADRLVDGAAGARVFDEPVARPVLAATGAIGVLAVATLGAAARPVRAIMFDKTAATNWRVAWHQDRTIAVRQRRDVVGFGPWSVKAGMPHVEPPFTITEQMVTLRAHLDPCDDDNAPLLIVPGSHRLGRLPAADIAATATRLGQAVCYAAAGDVWLYATAIVHASEPARQPHRRRVLQVDYAAMDLPAGLEWIGI